MSTERIPGEEPEDTRRRKSRAGRDDPADLVRTQDFEVTGPIGVDVNNGLGPIEVELVPTELVHVEVRHDPAATGLDLRGGIAGLLNWVGEQFGEAGARAGLDAERLRTPREPVAEAVRRTRIDLTGNRLAVRTPGTAPLRGVPLAVRVTAPESSSVSIHTSSGEVAVTGRAGRISVQSGSGTVAVERAEDRATVRSGAGQLRLGDMAGGVHARSGNGDIEIGELAAASTVATGSGDVWLGSVRADVLVRSGGGDVTVSDAATGQVELITGSGEVHAAIRRGALAEVDLSSSTGAARSDLDVTDQPPDDQAGLRIYGRSGTGDVVLTSAT
ncbi:DUF4097 family beta strand repeat protein [Saccharopolyspora sp. HNM0983]|uniref:DUF4097 family beta strand repeat protein n=1 Tax=Saccharopolyspora montiporae TaxID=2781240 RepID=A0A929B6W9_9PSEU|nr:DUF4097 family beta strand repeat-containing protein [Saccharopolyspora sp. HNM0983]MBE9374299.1 DUF4097 family beta strand repeat protein [Saccharopolyspora sp. HNM0983]